MADTPDTPGPGSGPGLGNGLGNGVKRDLALAWTLGGCISALVAIGGASILWPPAQWDLVNKIVDAIATLTLILAGGLGVKTRS